jgi:hypothetical protein
VHIKIVRSLLVSTAAALILAAAAAPAFAAAQNAAAEIPSTPTQLVRDYSSLGLCLAASGNLVGAAHNASCSADDPHQFWEFVPVDDVYQIRSSASGEVSDGYR